MTDQLILTEELLKEFLDPQLSKFYEYKVEDKLPANCKFQVSFQDEHEKQYFFSFFRENALGKNSRKVVLSVKKNKSTTFKINVDKGSFLRILGTLVRAYEEYKTTEDGLKCTSFGFYFPDTFGKYAPFVVRLISRMWKTEPKKRLALYGAAESYQASLVLLYVNVNSMVPYFGGSLMNSPEAVDIFKGQFYDNLAGIHKNTADKTVKKVENPQQPTTTQSMIAKKQASVAQSKLDAPAAPIQQATPGINTHPEHEDAGQDGWVEPYKDDSYNYGGIEATHIRMKVNSGSSSLKVGQEAEIYGVYMNSNFDKCYAQFGLTQKAAENAMDGCNGVLIVKPNSNPSKYVALSLTAMTSNTNAMFWYLDADNKSPVDIENDKKKEEAEAAAAAKLAKKPKDIVKVVTNPNATVIHNFGPNYQKALEETLGQVKVGPVTVKLDGFSVIEISEKLTEINDYFGKMSYDQARKIASEIKSQISYKFDQVNDAFIDYCRENGLFAPDSNNAAMKAVKKYTGSAYANVNRYLRGIPLEAGENEQDQIDLINDIDKAFMMYGVKLPRNFKVYRGASASMADIEALNKYDSIPLNGYSSVSTKPQIAEDFTQIQDQRDVIAGQVAAANGDNDQLSQQHFGSKQGNKILYSIDRLDRCLSLLARDASKFANEEEIILNRGTEVVLKGGDKLSQKVYRVCKRMKSDWYLDGYSEDQGIWFARTEIAPNSLKESTLRGYLLREAVQQASDAMDNLAILSFYIDDILE